MMVPKMKNKPDLFSFWLRPMSLKRPFRVLGVDDSADDDNEEQYPDGTPVERNANGRLIPRMHELRAIPRHDSDQGFAPIRFVQRYTMAEGWLGGIRSKASNSAQAKDALGLPLHPSLAVPADAWKCTLERVDTMSLRAFAQTCCRFALLARSVLTERLKIYPFITSPIHLSTIQMLAFGQAVHRRKNIFVTGEGGSGKTVLLRTIADTLRRTEKVTGDIFGYDYFKDIANRRALPDNADDEVLKNHDSRHFLKVLVVAPTGTAAEVCGGQTSASVFGNPPIEVIENWNHYRPNVHRGDQAKIVDADVIIWDEISMVSCHGLEYAERVCRAFRPDSRPHAENRLFGGLQTIFFGDFAQLPPVSKSMHPNMTQRCFLSPVWKRLFGDPYSIDSPNMILLPCTMRQSTGDTHFLACLRELRTCNATATVSTLIAERSFPKLKEAKDPCLTLPSVVIASTNANVNEVNENQLRFLVETQKAYSRYYVSWFNRVRSPQYVEELERPTFRMVVGARVSLTRNALYYHLSNGSLGKIVYKVDLLDSSTLAGIKSGELIFLSNLPYSIRESVSGTLKQSSPHLDHYIGDAVYPVVEFDSQPGKKYVVAYWTTPIGITRHEELADGDLKRYELPLRVSFAQSTHRMQGSTLSDVAVRIQLEDAFIPELIYVALSRVRSVKQLVITSAPRYARFYGATARQTMCEHTKRFLACQNLRLENYLLQRKALDAERRLIEKEWAKRERSSNELCKRERSLADKSDGMKKRSKSESNRDKSQCSN